MEIEVLAGGVANAGAVVRFGDRVRRPSPSNAAVLHGLLRHVCSSAAGLVPMPHAIEDGTEVLEFVSGDVATAPYPEWANSVEALRSVGALVRLFHDATVGWKAPQDAVWPTDFADSEPGAVICHNDVCIENVVFRSGTATALIDVDFAAPGRRVWDLAHTARYWVPLTDPTLPAATERGITDPISRLRDLVDAYGLDDRSRAEFVEVALDAEHVSRTFMEQQVDAGNASFTAIWNDAARRRFDIKIAWIETQASAIASALQ